MNFNKYDPLAKEKELVVVDVKVENGSGDPGLRDWKDSAPVVRLSEYLKSNPDQGIKLVLSDGMPALVFEPGLTKACTPKTKERWTIATNCLSLLYDALTDLRHLISIGSINLPEITAGPPGVLNS
jgi:hypothetical protein